MRFMKNAMLLGLVAAFAAVLAVPAIASANWTKEGGNLSNQVQWSEDGLPLADSQSISFQGPIAFEGEWGGVECDITLNGTASPGGGGSISEASVSAPSCAIDPTLEFYGCKSVSSVTADQLPWPAVTARSGGQKAIYLGVNLTYTFSGGIICKALGPVTVTGLVVAKPDDADGIGSVTLSGVVGAETKYSEPTSYVSGSLNVTPSGAYGLMTTNTVALSGTLGWEGELGSMSCSINGNLALEPGTEGALTSLDWSSCWLGGGYEAVCGAVESVTSGSLPTTVVNEGSKIRISDFSLTIDYTKCGNENVTGTLYATPNDSEEISSTSLSGVLKSNGTTDKTWSGSVNWSPAGVYGL